MTSTGASACRFCRAQAQVAATNNLAGATQHRERRRLKLLVAGGVILLFVSAGLWLFYWFIDGFRRAL